MLFLRAGHMSRGGALCLGGGVLLLLNEGWVGDRDRVPGVVVYEGGKNGRVFLRLCRARMRLRTLNLCVRAGGFVG